MNPKIVFLDMEGTLLKKEVRLDDGLVAPSAWTLLAEKLGPECYKEEQATKERWNAGAYKNYLEWMKATVDIHRKHELTEAVFQEVIKAVEFTPGVEDALERFREWGSVTILISGGFKALADRVQRRLRIDHALSGCEYFFDSVSKRIEHFNLLPADEGGKADFMRLMCLEYQVTPQDCAFVGDGKNDVHLAREVGFSIAFNAQDELKRVATVVIDQPAGKEDFREVVHVMNERFSGKPMSSDNNWPLYIKRKFALGNARYKDSEKVLSAAPNGSAEINAKDAVEWIYGVLTTLDAKASALMRLNGVLIAAAAFLLGLFGRIGGSILSTSSFDAVLIVVCAALSAISITCCLFVVNVSWPFLGKVTRENGNFNFAAEIKALDETCSFRQVAYQRAWKISLFASLGFLMEFVWQMAYVVYHSFFGL